ncbi:hypothetical protein Adt_27763 [Abeliophyllum distichum]|uniref:Uncharacterized protein n=1 Tax=Abeliophyllum distichum TaxID=126358 RepID=A0ABD1RUM7_9LAMI
MGLSHWDSTTLQLAPPMEQRFAQVPHPLGLDRFTVYSSHGAMHRSSASPTGTRPPYSLLLPWSNAVCKCLSYWDLATLQFAPPMEQRSAQWPFQLEFGLLAVCSSHGAMLCTSASPLGLCHISACSSHGAMLRSSTCHRTWHTMENKTRPPHKCPSRTLWDLICLPEFKN